MEITSQQSNKLAVKKKSRGLEERVNKKFEIALNKPANKMSTREIVVETESRLAKKIDKIFIILDGIARSHDAFKIKLVALKRVSLLRREKLLKDEL